MGKLAKMHQGRNIVITIVRIELIVISETRSITANDVRSVRVELCGHILTSRVEEDSPHYSFPCFKDVCEVVLDEIKRVDGPGLVRFLGKKRNFLPEVRKFVCMKSMESTDQSAIVIAAAIVQGLLECRRHDDIAAIEVASTRLVL